MKCLRYIALLLTVAIIIFAFCSCGTSGKTVFENALKAISAPDFEKLSFYVKDGSLKEIYSMREYFSFAARALIAAPPEKFTAKKDRTDIIKIIKDDRILFIADIF